MNESCIRPRYRKKQRPPKQKVTAADLLAAIFTIYMLGGSTSGSYLYISIGLMGLWMIFAFAASPDRFLGIFRDKKLLCFLVYLIYIAVVGFPVGGALYTTKQLGSALLLFSPILLFNYFMRDKKKLYCFLIIALIVWAFFCGKALIFYESFQHAARTLASHRDAYGNVSIGGGYSLAYGSAILSVILFSLLITKKIKGRWKRFFIMVLVLLSALVVFQTESTVTISCFVVGVLAALLFRPIRDEKQKTISQNFLKVLMFAVLVLILIAGMKPIGEWIGKMTKQSVDIVGIRLHSFGAALAGEGSAGEYAISRLTIPLKSLNTFCINPFFGVAYQHGNGFLDSGNYGIGNHCEWADALGNYGIIGGLPFLMMYILQVKETAKERMPGAWWLVLLLMGTFNPFRAFQSDFVVFFIVPAVASLLAERSAHGVRDMKKLEPISQENKENFKNAFVCNSRSISK